MNNNNVLPRGNRRNGGQARRLARNGQRATQNALVQPPQKVPLGTVLTRDLARMRMDPTRNGIVVRNREIIKTISRTATTGTYPFGLDSIDVRFVNSSTLPVSPGFTPLNLATWIGQMSVLYDKFIVRKLRFEFVSSMPFTITGQVGMYFDSDPDAALPTTFAQISGNVYAESVQVSQPLNLLIRPNQLNRLPQYATSAVNTTGSSQAATRVGILQFVNQAGILNTPTVTGAFDLGTLWMDYEIEFLNPSNPSTATPPTVLSAKKPKPVLTAASIKAAGEAIGVPNQVLSGLKLEDMATKLNLTLFPAPQVTKYYMDAPSHDEL